MSGAKKVAATNVPTRSLSDIQYIGCSLRAGLGPLDQCAQSQRNENHGDDLPQETHFFIFGPLHQDDGAQGSK